MDTNTKKVHQEEQKEPVLDASHIRSDEPIGKDEQHVLDSDREQLKEPGINRRESSNAEKASGSKMTESKNQSAVENEEEDVEVTKVEIKEKRHFVRAVYTIVLLQTTCTFILCYLASDNNWMSRFFNNIIVIIMSYLILLGSLMVFFLTNISQISPLNYILLFIFTISESVVIAGWTSDMKTDTIIY